MGTALLGRWLLGLPGRRARRAAAARSARPGCSRAPAWRPTAGARAALATPIVLIAMLVGTQGVVPSSSQHDTEDVTAARVTAAHVVVGRDGAPLPAGTAADAGCRASTPSPGLPTQVFLLGKGLTGWDARGRPPGLGALGRARSTSASASGDLGDVRGDAVAVSRVVAAEGHLEVGDVVPVRLADTTPATLRVAAIYDRAAGLGDVVLDPAVARRHAATRADAAVFVAGGRGGRSLAATPRPPGVRSLTRAQYLGTVARSATTAPGASG